MRRRSFGFASLATSAGPLGDRTIPHRALITALLAACTLAAAIGGAGTVAPPGGATDAMSADELSWPLSDGRFAQSPLGTRTAASETEGSRAAERYGKLPLAFEQNRGQTDNRVDFLARASGHTAFLTPTGATLALQGSGNRAEGAALRLELTGADPAARPIGEEQLPGEVNVLRGKDSGPSVTGAETFARVRYGDVYPRIDLAWYGTQEGRLEYDFLVRPGADPSVIGLELEGAKRVSLTASGALHVATAAGTIVQPPPVAYQEIAGERRAVKSRYELSGRRVQLGLGAYDRGRLLVIDPVLDYSTFVGGSSTDVGLDVAVDSQGSAYMTGWTNSRDYPTTPGAFDQGRNNAEAVVTKLNPAGSALEYSTYLGGTSADEARDIAVDAQGSAYLIGKTSSSNFPTTAGAYDETFNGGEDAFVTKLNATGSALEYSTLLGGSSIEEGTGIAIDAEGTAYVSGRTHSGDYPTTAGSYDQSFDGPADAFVTKLSPAGSALDYSTFLGGTSALAEQGHDVAIDGEGSAYVGGWTAAADFPTTPGAYDESANGNDDAFVTKLNPAGSALDYSTFLGGFSFDAAFGIALDGQGSAYLTGFTGSADYPTTPGAYDETSTGSISDAFVTKLSPTGSALGYSTYLGGEVEGDGGEDIAVDEQGSATIAGFTRAADYPTTADAHDQTFNGVEDAVVTKLNSAGSALEYSTFLGGTAFERGHGIAVDGRGATYVTGSTQSPDYPTTPGAFDETHNGNDDAFVTKLGAGQGPPANLTLEPATATNTVDEEHCVTATVTDEQGNPVPGVSVVFEVAGANSAGGTVETDDEGQAEFCYTGALPGEDVIRAFADTDGSGSQDPGEPGGEATKAWVLPASTEGCKVTGGGHITAANGDRATFGGNAQVKNGEPKGNETYQDHGPATPLKVKSTEILAVTCSSDRTRASIFGTAEVDGEGSFDFRIDVADNGEPGRDDTYRIRLSNGYDSGEQRLEGGNIQIHE